MQANRTIRRFTPKSALSLLSVLFVAFAGAAATPPAEKLLPDDTLAMVSIPDFAKTRDIYNNSAQGQLWRDPSLKAFKDKFMDKLRDQLLGPLAHDLGVHLEDYSDLPQGQLTIAATQDASGKELKDQTPAVLFLMDAKDKSEQLKTAIADLRKKWLDKGNKLRTETIRNVEFSVVTISTNDFSKVFKKSDGDAKDSPDAAADSAKNAPAKQDAYIGQTGSLLVIGSSPRAIERVLANLGGSEAKTVGDLPAFESNQAMFRDAPLYGWVNTKALVDIFTHLDETPNQAGFTMAKLASALGFTGLKSLAVSYQVSDEGSTGSMFLAVPESSRTGIFKILAGEPKEFAPPAFVPIDAVKFQRWRIDGQKTWATIQKTLSDINPEWINGLNMILTTAEGAAKEKNPDFDIKKNLFGNLGDDIISYSKAPKGSKLADLSAAPSLTLIGSPNPEQLTAAVRSVVVLFGLAGAPKEREFLGHKIYSLPLPGAPNAKGTAETRSLSYAYGGGYLAISQDDGILEEYLRSSAGEGKSLRDTPGLAEATQKVAGTGTSVFSYSNDKETTRFSLEAVKQDFDALVSDGGMAPLLGALGLSDTAKLKEWFDVSLLPDYDKISKYFSFSVFAETATPEGLVFKGYTPTPPTLRQQAAAGK